MSDYPWIGAGDKEYIRYMDLEWGSPVHNDRKLFEMLILESFQAGLSWATILKRRKAFRNAFSNWSVRKVAAFSDDDMQRLLQNPGIIRNRLKIKAAVQNAGQFIAIQKEFGSFDAWLWSFTDGKVVKPKKPYRSWGEVPAETELSRAISKALKKRGFSFLGPVATYAFMQAVGLVDDRVL